MLPSQPIEIKVAGDWAAEGKAPAQAGGDRVYEATFNLANGQEKMFALLDLGKVENYCEVVINDSASLSDHWLPYEFMATGRLKPGANKLKITVRHQPQPALRTPDFYTPAPPVLTGPVVVRLWK